jgi:hypothetical protein
LLQEALTMAGAKRSAHELAGEAFAWCTRSDLPPGVGPAMAYRVGAAEDLLAPLLFIAANHGLAHTDVIRWVAPPTEHVDESGYVSELSDLALALCHRPDAQVAGDAEEALGILAAAYALETRETFAICDTAIALLTGWRHPVTTSAAVIGDLSPDAALPMYRRSPPLSEHLVWLAERTQPGQRDDSGIIPNRRRPAGPITEKEQNRESD